MRRLIATIAATALLILPSTAYAADGDAEMLARVIYTEARGVDSVTEQAAVAWCVLNRVDDERWGDTVAEVVTERHQFAWDADAPVTDELLALAKDVLLRWQLEKLGVGDVGRVLPRECVYFAGRDGRNWFRTEYGGGEYWGWTGVSPYEEQCSNCGNVSHNGKTAFCPNCGARKGGTA